MQSLSLNLLQQHLSSLIGKCTLSDHIFCKLPFSVMPYIGCLPSTYLTHVVAHQFIMHQTQSSFRFFVYCLVAVFVLYFISSEYDFFKLSYFQLFFACCMTNGLALVQRELFSTCYLLCVWFAEPFVCHTLAI